MGFGEENGQKLHAGKNTRLLAILPFTRSDRLDTFPHFFLKIAVNLM